MNKPLVAGVKFAEDAFIQIVLSGVPSRPAIKPRFILYCPALERPALYPIFILA